MSELETNLTLTVRDGVRIIVDKESVTFSSENFSVYVRLHIDPDAADELAEALKGFADKKRMEKEQ